MAHGRISLGKQVSSVSAEILLRRIKNTGSSGNWRRSRETGKYYPFLLNRYC